MTEKLLPCPFCGKTPNCGSGHHQEDGAVSIWFECPDGCAVSREKPTYDEALAVWNTRRVPAPASLSPDECCVPGAGEPSFVFLGRDPQAPALIEKWADDRERARPTSNKPGKARAIAAMMRVFKENHPGLGMDASALSDAPTPADATTEAPPAHNIMTDEEYASLRIKGWHLVCKDYHGEPGCVAIQYMASAPASPSPSTAMTVVAESDAQLAEQIHRVAGCHASSDRTRKIIEWYRSKATTPPSFGNADAVREQIVVPAVAPNKCSCCNGDLHLNGASYSCDRGSTEHFHTDDLPALSSAPVANTTEMPNGILDREAVIAKYRAMPTKEGQFIALCVSQFGSAPVAGESTFDGRMLHERYDGNGRPRVGGPSDPRKERGTHG